VKQQGLGATGSGSSPLSTGKTIEIQQPERWNGLNLPGTLDYPFKKPL